MCEGQIYGNFTRVGMVLLQTLLFLIISQVLQLSCTAWKNADILQVSTAVCRLNPRKIRIVLEVVQQNLMKSIFGGKML